ncbi:MAG: ArsR family transcriptional regulator [Nitriliruptoraceae bacterium]
MTIAEATDRVATPAPSLTALLGDARAAVVDLLRDQPDQSATELAESLGISAVATRRHLAVLEGDGFVSARTVKQTRGRPAARYRVTEAANRLLPHRYDAFANELVEFLVARYGTGVLRDFLQWRMSRETADLRGAVTADELPDRLEQLAAALSHAGFDATVDRHDDRFTLVQHHCAIEDVARQHPEVCAFEAASFSQVLGQDVTLSRRETLANGGAVCVCTVAPRDTANSTISGRTTTHERSDERPRHQAADTTRRGVKR